MTFCSKTRPCHLRYFELDNYQISLFLAHEFCKKSGFEVKIQSIYERFFKDVMAQLACAPHAFSVMR